MTERTKGSQQSGSPQEAIDLTELRASRAQTELSSANTDLASASIQSTNVVRLSVRPEMRKVSSPSISLGTDPEATRDTKPSAPQSHARNQKHGILRNPYFRYEGGPLGRLITLVANLLKALETAVFNTIKPTHSTPPAKTVVAKAKRKDAYGKELDEEQEAVERRDKSTEIHPRRE